MDGGRGGGVKGHSKLSLRYLIDDQTKDKCVNYFLCDKIGFI